MHGRAWRRQRGGLLTCVLVDASFRPALSTEPIFVLVRLNGTLSPASAAHSWEPPRAAEKIERAAKVRGPSYIHCHAPCPTGRGVESANMIEVSRLAVQTGCVLLHEVIDGKRKLSKRFGKRKRVQEYLVHQGRFRHLLGDAEAVAAIQRGIDERHEAVSRTMG